LIASRRVSALFCTSGIWTTVDMAAELIVSGFMQSSLRRALAHPRSNPIPDSGGIFLLDHSWGG